MYSKRRAVCRKKGMMCIKQRDEVQQAEGDVQQAKRWRAASRLMMCSKHRDDVHQAPVDNTRQTGWVCDRHEFSCRERSQERTPLGRTTEEVPDVAGRTQPWHEYGDTEVKSLVYRPSHDISGRRSIVPIIRGNRNYIDEKHSKYICRLQSYNMGQALLWQ